ncbi:MAG: SAM-dependent chlorinase/fluorinase [Bacteroidota bacterium]|nr:SAM-dependent chlorinase/fluorinase [Bacteroidota bacterium]
MRREIPIVTLTSDWGTRDYYVGAVKGNLLRHIPGVNIVDISHDIDPYDIIQTAFVLRNSYKYYPKGTIHIIGVDTDASLENPHAMVYADGHYFIGADTGVFSLILDKKPEKIIYLDIIQKTPYLTFPSRDLFCLAAKIIADGDPLENLGDEAESINQLQDISPVIDKNIIRAKVIYIDRYQNLITNLSKEVFEKVGQEREYVIHFHKKEYDMDKISDSYNDSDINEADLMAIFGSAGLLEIALCRGKASELLGMTIDSSIIIKFVEEEENDIENSFYPKKI